MTARRDVGAAVGAGDTDTARNGGGRVDQANRALGERGPAWWSDGPSDLNRHFARIGDDVDGCAPRAHSSDAVGQLGKARSLA